MITEVTRSEELINGMSLQAKDTPLASGHPLGKIPSHQGASKAQRGLAFATPSVVSRGESEGGWGSVKTRYCVTSVNYRF